MSSRRWGVKTKDKRHTTSHTFITLTKLKLTIDTLKSRGGPSATNRWTSPMIPLLIEHLFIERHTNLRNIKNITLELNEGKDLKLC